jgi:threonine/homoserine/homoserine lactone efflux protein
VSLSVNLPLILSAAFIASASPGPATLAIAGASMRAGRRAGLTLALGVTTGSLAWSAAAALGLAAVMASNAWALEALRYFGAAYLLLLAIKSARSALQPTAPLSKADGLSAGRRAYLKGLALHLTNPKAIVFFGSLYTLGVSPRASAPELALVVLAVGAQSALIFVGYSLLFSNRRVAAGYMRLRRGFDGVFAVIFAAASVKALTARLAT